LAESVSIVKGYSSADPPTPPFIFRGVKELNFMFFDISFNFELAILLS
jgi:hypothetical protein